MTYLAPRQGIFAAIVLTSLVLHLLFFAISTERSITAQNQAVVDRSIATLSQELAAPLAAYDRVSMSVIMEPYAKEEAIGYVGVYDSQGGVLVPLGQSSDGYRAEQVITSGDQVLGKIAVQAKAVSRAEILSGNWVFLLSVIGLHVMLWLIYGYVARPSDELKAQIAKSVRKELLSKGILPEQTLHTAPAPAAAPDTASTEQVQDDEDEAQDEVAPRPEPEPEAQLAAAYTVQLTFKDPHHLLTTVSIDTKDAYLALCDQLFDRACAAVLELPLFAGVALADKHPFDESGTAVTLYATDDHAKTAAAAAVLSKLLVMVNEVVYQKHREIKRFALPVKAVCSDSMLSDVAKNILLMRKEESLTIFGEAGRNQVSMYMTLAPLSHPSTVHERDGREIVGVTNATAERLKIARDKVLLGEDHS